MIYQIKLIQFRFVFRFLHILCVILWARSSLSKSRDDLSSHLLEMKEFKKQIRPGHNSTDTVKVKFKLFVNQILDVVSKVE